MVQESVGQGFFGLQQERGVRKGSQENKGSVRKQWGREQGAKKGKLSEGSKLVIQD